MMKHLILFFIDGLGLIADGPNPRVTQLTGHEITAPLNAAVDFDDMRMIPVDANLGVNGLPQSATGQASIFTGKNCAASIGFHLNAFPSRALVDVLNQDNIYMSLIKKGMKTASANLYTENYMTTRRRHSVSTHALLAAGIQMRSSARYRDGYAVTMDITNERVRAHDPSVPLISPEKAAENLLTLAERKHFVFFEYFLTDFCGHHQDAVMADSLFAILQRFFAVLRQWPDPKRALMLISDHGNVEDLSVSTHTRNPVPFLVYTPNRAFRDDCERRVRSIADVKKMIETYLDE